MKHKLNGSCILQCVCHLPSENSCRQAEVNAFYDPPLTSLYDYQNDGTIFICDDLNGCSGDLDDFVVGIVDSLIFHIVM